MNPDHKHMGLAAAVMSHEHKDPEMPKKMVHEMRIRKGKSGGHIIEHHHKMPMHHPMEEHTTSTKKQLADHVMQHMSEPDEAPEAGAGIPGTMPPSAGTQQMSQMVGGA